MVQEIDNVIEVIGKALKAIKNEDIIAIKDLSNQTVHSSTVYQDPDNINIAVILYALSKIIERTRYREMPGWDKFEKTYEDSRVPRRRRCPAVETTVQAPRQPLLHACLRVGM